MAQAPWAARRWSPSRRFPLLVLVVAALAALAVLAPSVGMAAVAAAQPSPGRQPPRLAGEVTDEIGALGGRREAVESSLADARRRGVHLHVLLTDTTGGPPATEWARTVAGASGMGLDDALLVVAFTDRTYGLWLSDELSTVTDPEMQAVLRAVETRLAQGDVAAAVVAAARGLADAHEGRLSAGDGSRRAFPWLLVLAAGVGVWLLYNFVRRRRTSRRAAEERDRRTGQLARDANVALVEADEALQEAEHEITFAEAQFGVDGIAPFRAAVDEARSALQEGFAQRQRLDDDPPRSHEERAQALRSIAAAARRSTELMAGARQRLDQLRDLERDPGPALDGARGRIDVLRAALEGAEVRRRALAATAPDVADAVEGNVTEAAKRLEAAAGMAAAAAAEVDAGGAAAAAQLIHRLEETVGQAGDLIEAIDRLADKVDAARAAVGGELQEAELAVARASDFIRARRGVVGRTARTRLAEAQRHLDEAQALRRRDPEAAVDAADEAESMAHEAYRLARDDAEWEDGQGRRGGGSVVWPVPFPVPFPGGGRRRTGSGWGGTTWGAGGGRVGGGGFGGGRVGGGRF